MNHVLLSTLLIAAPPHHPQSRAHNFPPHLSEDVFWGMYLNGNKTGWMHVVAGPNASKQFVVSVESHVKMRSMGHVSETDSTMQRVFSLQNEELISLNVLENTPNGTVKIEGHRTKDGFRLTTTRGADVKVSDVVVEEHLSDSDVDVRLAEHPTAGASADCVHFDVTQQRTLHSTYTVRGVETHNGVANTVHIAGTTRENKESSDEWLDRGGHMVAMQEGPFEMRPEAEAVAKTIEVKGDVAEDMMVHAPQAISAPQRVNEIQVDFGGMGNDFVPPQSPRQQVAKVGQYVSVMLRRDPLPTRSRIGEFNASEADKTDVQNALKPTSLLESDNPQVVETAHRIVAGEQDAFAASNRLVAYVARTLRKESIAGFGDALLILQSGKGDCTEHATLFVALARAAGVPARIVQGITYVPQAQGFGWHAWSEVFVGGRWIAVDPTFGQPIADATHIKMATGGAEMDGGVSQIMGKINIANMTVR